MTVAPVAVDAPRVAPALGGLLSVADIVDSTDPHIAFGIEYQSWLCEDGGYTSGCVDAPEGVPVDSPKLFGGSHIVEGVPVVVYAGVECDLFGAPYTQQALDRLAGSEDKLVASAFYRHAAWGAWSAGDAPVYLGQEVTAENVVEAIASLEQYAGEHYAGQPILHMNRYTATLAIAADVAVPGLDGSLTTGLGTPIAVSPGYPDGVIFITGAVHLWRTPTNAYQAPNLSTNTDMALAERTYVLSTDCLLAIAGTEEPPAELSITGIDPDTVEPGSTTELTITGANFPPDVEVTIAGEPVDVVSVSDTEIVVSWTAPNAPGEFPVVVSDGQSAASTTVTVAIPVPPPTVTSVVPDVGPVDGGVTVTITGTNFEE